MLSILYLSQMNMNVICTPTIRSISIITNIDFDHPDCFTSLEDVFDAFNDYAKTSKKIVSLYIGEDEQLRRVTANAPSFTMV